MCSVRQRKAESHRARGWVRKSVRGADLLLLLPLVEVVAAGARAAHDEQAERADEEAGKPVSRRVVGVVRGAVAVDAGVGALLAVHRHVVAGAADAAARGLAHLRGRRKASRGARFTRAAVWRTVAAFVHRKELAQRTQLAPVGQQ